MKKLLHKIGGILFLIALAFVAHINAATFVVNTTNDTIDANPGNGICADSAGDCSLRAAIGETNQLALVIATRINTISLPAGIYTLTITGAPNELNNASGDLNIRNSSNLTINGDNARTTIVQAGTVKSTNGTDGNGIDRVMRSFGTPVILTLNNLTIRHGKAPDGGGGSNSGGGILYEFGLSTGGGLNINNCAIVDNAATDSGGGILTNTTTNITNSLIARNVAFTFNFGGGIIGGGDTAGNTPLRLTNVTISGNSVHDATFGGRGGGLYNSGVSIVTNSTITGNSALGPNGTSGTAGGIFNGSSTIRLRNSIIAGNTAGFVGNDISTATATPTVVITGGTNLIGDATTSTGWDGTDLLNNTSANLGALANNGGQTDTHAVPTGSSALNAGQNCVVDLTCATFNSIANVTTDQRGENRLSNGFAPYFALFVDIGAFEKLAPTAANVSVSGRVLTPDGRGLQNSIVTITDSAGQIKSARSSTFGYFRFNEIEVGQTYIITVNSKIYQFAPQVLQVDEQIDKLYLAAVSENAIKR